jgi:hypothetical protein
MGCLLIKIIITIAMVFIVALFALLYYFIFSRTKEEYFGNISPENCIKKGGYVFSAGDGIDKCPIGKTEIATIEGYLWCHCKCCK